MVTGTCVPLDTWKKYSKWFSSDNIAQSFKSKNFHPEFLEPVNEIVYLETKHILDANISPLLEDEKNIAQPPDPFLVSRECTLPPASRQRQG